MQTKYHPGVDRPPPPRPRGPLGGEDGPPRGDGRPDKRHASRPTALLDRAAHRRPHRHHRSPRVRDDALIPKEGLEPVLTARVLAWVAPLSDVSTHPDLTLPTPSRGSRIDGVISDLLTEFTRCRRETRSQKKRHFTHVNPEKRLQFSSLNLFRGLYFTHIMI